MLAGLSLMDEANKTPVVKNSPAALPALCWHWASDVVGSKDMVVLPYKDSLLFFSRYLQQLVMESLGKDFDLDGNREHGRLGKETMIGIIKKLALQRRVLNF